MNESVLLLICLSTLLSLSSSCYIQNCPRGGKRSALESVSRQCMACGPGNKGRCFGPSICCGEEFGCLLASPQTVRCQDEEYLPSPCESAGKLCGPDEGRCAAPGVCCDAEGCTLDPNCSEDGTNDDVLEQGASPGEFLLRLLHMKHYRI